MQLAALLKIRTVNRTDISVVWNIYIFALFLNIVFKKTNTFVILVTYLNFIKRNFQLIKLSIPSINSFVSLKSLDAQSSFEVRKKSVASGCSGGKYRGWEGNSNFISWILAVATIGVMSSVVFISSFKQSLMLNDKITFVFFEADLQWWDPCVMRSYKSMQHFKSKSGFRL